MNYLLKAAVRRGERIFESNNPLLLAKLKEQIAKTELANKGVTFFEVGDECETCGSDKLHPKTLNCYVCDTDNWKSMKHKS